MRRIHLHDTGFHDGDRLREQIQLFPRDALIVKPSARHSQSRKNVPGSMDAVLADTFLAKVTELKLDKNDAIDQAFADWLESKNPR